MRSVRAWERNVGRKSATCGDAVPAHGRRRARPFAERGTGQAAATNTALAHAKPAGMDPHVPVAVVRRFGLPRACGDGPLRPMCKPCHSRASPRLRGWTALMVVDEAGVLGFPAPAGMDPFDREDREVEAWLPRACGDGPCARSSTTWPSSDSPRLRGWTRRGRFPPHHRGSSPRHAGTVSQCGHASLLDVTKELPATFEFRPFNFEPVATRLTAGLERPTGRRINGGARHHRSARHNAPRRGEPARRFAFRRRGESGKMPR